MRILYVTDLHGIEWKYDLLFEVAIGRGVDAVVNGGDMLPKGRDLMRQDDFIVDFLDVHFKTNSQDFHCMATSMNHRPVVENGGDESAKHYVFSRDNLNHSRTFSSIWIQWNLKDML